ncbi:MAG: NAD(P)/FAD-dependent oxidoreductase [Planctomycetia bacterium]|nr:NAD(P)/FAD-dependent oxidoreductase [Planctomycetia bacterium]
MHWDVVVVGAGAAGLVAAERAASRGRTTLLLDKNTKPGVKILMSGGTRCNLTQATDARGIVEAYGPPGRFLHSALAALSPQDLVALVEAEGVPTKVEETGKIFPVSNKATDVLAAFVARLRRSPCELALQEPVVGIERAECGGFRLVTSRQTLSAERVIVTSGGQSYPGCGTTGDGYAWATRLGHTLVPPRPALVPITTPAAWVRSLSGITVPDAAVRVVEPGDKPRVLDARRGSLLFAHFGLSGPVVLDVSRHVSGHLRPQTLRLECDFLPMVGQADLDAQLKRQAAAEGKKQLLTLVPEVVPRRLAEALVREAGLAPESKAAELSKAGRAALVRAIKQASIPVTGTRGFAKAEVTAGGVPLAEVDSRTLASKIVPGLYLAGEVLDLDGPIGGYNFQAAFSTGWLAGLSV